MGPAPHRTFAGLLLAGAVALAAAGCGSSSASEPAATTPAAHGKTTTTAGGGNPSGSTTSTSTTTPAGGAGGAAGGAAALQQAFVSVVAKVRPSVVEVTSQTGGATSLGSGVIYDAKGDIVTNAHVVGSATSFQVTFMDGKGAKASLVGVYRSGDLAVIRVPMMPELRPATFGDSKSLQIGDITLAIGNPLGLASSVTEGIVSFNGRSVSESNSVTLPSTIQTSAPINPGNSGGALVDLDGDVIGIPTLAATDQEGGSAAAGIGFAIPSDTVKQIAPQLISSGKVTDTGRAELGITASTSNAASGQANGVVVVNVVAGGPAQKAGIPPGAVITSINGTATPSLPDLQDLLAGLNPGQQAQVTYRAPNGGAMKTVTLTLAQLPNSNG